MANQIQIRNYQVDRSVKMISPVIFLTGMSQSTSKILRCWKMQQ
ncbi:hypothetical protein [Planomicrobium sp. YIM 101495]|nr:hypothetical protein [Planomicrobium sp. YIM 101495]